ncbi:phosphatidylinositol 3- and 4-kinase domain-containing protein [Ditylenchus destructor]|nr:phosphatidylinositol 3- and 4-kinase domain-containing protein [Ditylenchus destructor]
MAPHLARSDDGKVPRSESHLNRVLSRSLTKAGNAKMSLDNAPIINADSVTYSNTAESEVSDPQKVRVQLSQYIASTKKYEVNNSNDFDFNENLRRAVQSLDGGIYPELIPDGSSGSYFIRGIDGTILAVFKPKDEEPFAPLNPKWPKFFQRILCFCCFGRACLIPNHGYLSETGASLVDCRLKFGIVPKTRIVKLCSPTFFYGRSCGRAIVPKPKEGSYQLFVHDHKSAATVLNEWNEVGLNNALTLQEIHDFTVLFQKMCILDYIIRNTDRHMDNWLIRHVPGVEIRIAAIDNGLAFPIKHPETSSLFRQFPFNWSTLSWAHKPWDDQLRESLLNDLTPIFVHNLCKELSILFRHDKSYNHLLTLSQMRVVRGQLWNLRESLIAKESPFALIKRQPLLVARRYKKTLPSDDWEQCFKARIDEEDCRACC